MCPGLCRNQRRVTELPCCSLPPVHRLPQHVPFPLARTLWQMHTQHPQDQWQMPHALLQPRPHEPIEPSPGSQVAPADPLLQCPHCRQSCRPARPPSHSPLWPVTTYHQMCTMHNGAQWSGARARAAHPADCSVGQVVLLAGSGARTHAARSALNRKIQSAVPLIHSDGLRYQL